MNKVQLFGRLTRDPEGKFTQSGMMIVKFTLAVDAGKDKPANFIKITAFGKTAEVIAAHVKKGHRLLVEGHIQTGSYEKDGKSISTTDIILEQFTFIETKKDLNK